MNTFLITWNPKWWKWNTLDNDIAEVGKKGFLDSGWSCGKRKQIEKGDRVFLLRQGVLPKGIVASGSVSSHVYEGKHWDERRAGQTALYVDVRFDTLLHPDREPILDRTELNTGNLAAVHWDTQMSGIRIPPGAAGELESLWASFLDKSERGQIALPEEVQTPELYKEGTTRQISVNVYERSAPARKECVEHYGAQCSVCGFDFEKFYGPDGHGVIHVHHLKPLSEVRKEYVIDPVNDLRPVCPNCHTMIHKGNKMMSIEQLKKMIGH